MKICHWCHEELRFILGRGYIHRQGGIYAMVCRACGWKGALYPSPTACPQCGQGHELRDDHCARPEEAE